MAVWSQLNPSKPHVAYCVLSVFAAFYSVCSSIVKENLYLGEAVLAAVYGLIVGPHCLKWFDPLSWLNNNKNLTLEISRILLCLDIFTVGVELPKKYMYHHFWSVISLMVPIMIMGWLVIGLFIWAIFPHMKFTYGLLISATITATDPVLAQAVVGQGKFGRKIPAHLRNLLCAESACNDGMAVPFVYLALNLVLHAGNSAEIAKDFICKAVLYECVFGVIVGTAIGYLGRKAAQFSHKHGFIDRECLLVFYFILAVMCAGFCSTLGADDLLASFAAGCAFAWDGWVAVNTADSDASTVLDLILNISYFVYLGAIIPWQQFNDRALGLDVWRLILLAIAVIFLRRIPEALVILPFCPDIKSWQEAVFVGHFGPIGVGAVFASILAISELQASSMHILSGHGPVSGWPDPNTALGSDLYYIIRVIWPIVCFLIVTSIIVHGSSPAVMAFAKHVRAVSFTKLDHAHEQSRQSQLAASFHGDASLSRVATHIDASIDRTRQLLAHYCISDEDLHPVLDSDGTLRSPHRGYEDGKNFIIEDQFGEIMSTLPARHPAPPNSDLTAISLNSLDAVSSIHRVKTWTSSIFDMVASKVTRRHPPDSGLQLRPYDASAVPNTTDTILDSSHLKNSPATVSSRVRRDDSSDDDDDSATIDSSACSQSRTDASGFQVHPLASQSVSVPSARISSLGNSLELSKLPDGSFSVIGSDGVYLGTIKPNHNAESVYAQAVELSRIQDQVDALRGQLSDLSSNVLSAFFRKDKTN